MKRKRASRKTSSLWAVLWVMLLLVAACGQRPVYSHFEHVDADGWNRTDTLRFAVPLGESGTYAHRLTLRTDACYPFAELALVASQRLVRDTLYFHADTLVLSIADGEGNIGGAGIILHEHAAPLKPLSPVHQPDTLLISVTHQMSLRQLPGIADVGITTSRVGDFR